ncbi:MAG: Spy/CpxP family protein refolding chaperone [Kofleriaceae bacterium]
MLCHILGFGLLAALTARLVARRHLGHHGGCHGGGGHGCGHRRGWGHHHRGWGRHRVQRLVLHRALERIDATPAQERAIVAEVDRLEARLREARRGLADLRAPLAEAVRSPALDDDVVGTLTDGVDARVADARAAMVDALRAIHALLDPGQRATLATLLADGRAGGGPYRG